MVDEEPAGNRPSGTITIVWEDFGTDEEPNFRFTRHWDPPLGSADRVRLGKLLRLIAEMSEAELETEWPVETDQG